ncbi:hypothetical protein [Achromobacter pulmonis]|uniref:hypothetical protein n=1 Tax=Achromobacter pulmonis TaxID=1389932 RepID=UPI0011B20789|nr:hypothetical protein [Achromobacter pulmonis]
MTPIQDMTEPGAQVLTKRFKAQRSENAWFKMQKRARVGAFLRAVRARRGARRVTGLNGA